MRKTNKQLYQLIAEYRKSKGITQVYISEVTGIDNKRLSNIEMGRVELKADEFVLLCEQGLNINPSFFTNQLLEYKNVKVLSHFSIRKYRNK